MPSRSFIADSTVRQAVPYVANRTSLVITVESTSVAGAKVFISENPRDPSADGIPLLEGDVYDKRKALGEDPTLARYVVTSSGTATLKIEEDYMA
jgi:hypothetical protein